jgi:hypothetical protein
MTNSDLDSLGGASAEDPVKTPVGDDYRRGVPAPGSVYAVLALTLVVASASLLLALGLSAGTAAWIKALYLVGLVAVVFAGFWLAYRIELRRRFIYSCRLEALDLAYAVEVKDAEMVADWLGKDIAGVAGNAGSQADADPAAQVAQNYWEWTIDEVRRFEDLLVDAGAYRDAADVSDARRRAEAELKRGWQ